MKMPVINFTLFSFLVGKTTLNFFLLLFFCSYHAFADDATDKLKKQAEKALRQGNFIQAEKLWREVLNVDAADHNARLGLSYTLYKQRLLVLAYQEAVKVAEEKPKNARARAIIGVTLLAAGNFAKAREFFDDAYFLDNDEALAFAGSAMLDYYENRSQRAMPKLRRAVFLDSREPDFIFALAQVASRIENYKEAANAYKRFLEIAPNTDTDRRERILGLIAFLRYLGEQKALYTVSGKRQTMIDVEIIDSRPVIKVRLNGRVEPLNFVIDSGSGITVLSDDTANRLGIDAIARGGKARAIGGDGKFDIVYGFVSSLDIGEARISKVPVYIRKFHNISRKTDGYIGLSVLAKFLTTLDYGNKTFTLVRQPKNNENEPKNEPENNPYLTQATNSSVPLRLTTSGFLSGEVKVESINEPMNFIIDTGASVSVVAESTARFYEMQRFAQTTLMRVYGAAGVAENVTSLKLPRVSLGLNSQERIEAAVLDLAPVNETTGFEQSGILGGNFLKNYRITFDFKNARLTLEPISPRSPKLATDAVVGEIFSK
jgi:predicted aspartyl protease/Flp pilus assembly protein TadD